MRPQAKELRQPQEAGGAMARSADLNTLISDFFLQTWERRGQKGIPSGDA